jgi:hypothetical protein
MFHVLISSYQAACRYSASILFCTSVAHLCGSLHLFIRSLTQSGKMHHAEVVCSLGCGEFLSLLEVLIRSAIASALWTLTRTVTLSSTEICRLIMKTQSQWLNLGKVACVTDSQTKGINKRCAKPPTIVNPELQNFAHFCSDLATTQL